jgi:hypothetical protein
MDIKQLNMKIIALLIEGKAYRPQQNKQITNKTNELKKHN